MKLSLGSLGLVSLFAVACSTPSSDEHATSDQDLTVPTTCFAPSGLDQPFPTVDASGGSSSVGSPLEIITGVTAVTASNGILEVHFGPGTKATDTIERTLPSDDVTVEFSAQPNPNDFFSPTVTFTATAGQLQCARRGSEFACTLTGLVLEPPASATNACASPPVDLELVAPLAAR